MNTTRAKKAAARLHRRLRSHRFPRWAGTLLAGLAIFAVAFVVAAFFVAPALVNHAIHTYAGRQPGRIASVTDIHIEPFSLTVQLDGAKLAEPDDGTRFSASAVRLNFNFRTLFSHELILDEVSIESPSLRLTLAASAAELEERLAKAVARMGPFHIQNFRVVAASLQLVDPANSSRSLALDGLNIDGANLSTEGAAGPGRYSLSADSFRLGKADAAELHLAGAVSLQPLSTAGRGKIAGLRLEALAPWLGAGLAAMAPSGRADFAARYTYTPTESGATDGWQISEGQGTVEGLGLSFASGLAMHTPIVRIDHVAATGSSGGTQLQGSMSFAGGATASLAFERGEPEAVRQPEKPRNSPAAAGALEAAQRPVKLRLALKDLPSSTLSAFTLWSLDRRLTAGQANLDLDYSIGGTQLEGQFKLHGQGLVFAPAKPAVAVPDQAGAGGGVPSQAGASGIPGEAAASAAAAPGQTGRAANVRSRAEGNAVPGQAGATAGAAKTGGAAAAPDQAGASAAVPRQAELSAVEAPPVGLDFALALLENPTGAVELDAPISVDRAPRAAGVSLPARIAGATSDALRGRLRAIVAAPFDVLAAVAGAPPATLHAVRFEAGTAEPSESGHMSLEALAAALKQRPRLRLSAAGGFAQSIDRHALATQEMELHVALATAGAKLNATPGPIDFASPRDQEILDEFAAERLTAERRATIASEFDLGRGPQAAPAQRSSYYRAIFDALVAQTEITHMELVRLGRFRARAIAGALDKLGVAGERIKTGDGTGQLEAIDGQVAVPLELGAAGTSFKPAFETSNDGTAQE